MTKFIDVTEIVDRASLRRVHMQVLAIGLLVSLVDGFDNQALAFVAPALSREWNVTPSALAPAFASGLVGMMLGSMLFGEMSDRVGRRLVFIVATASFGVVTLLTPFCGSVTALTVLRFLGGLGLGGLPSVMVSLVIEYTPRRHRATFGNWAFVGIPTGGFLGGLVAAYLIPHFGWPSVYWAGGVLTLTIAVVTALFLPESILFTLVRRNDQPRARALLARVEPDLPNEGTLRLSSRTEAAPQTSIASAFRDGRGRMTALFWIAEFILLMGYYFLVNWTPILLTRAGLPVATAVLGSVALNVGGITFGLAAGYLCDHLGGRRVMCALFLLAGLSLVGATQVGGSVPLLMTAIFLAGGAWISGQAAMMVLIADSYPTAIRGIATGWALGIGRIGAIISPAVVAIPLGLGWEVRQILLLPVLPALLGAACILFARPAPLARPVHEAFSPAVERVS